MARPATEGKKEAMQQIRTHLATKGDVGVNDIRDNFYPRVPKGTWYNWVLEAKKKPYSPEDMDKARQVLARTIEDPALLDREMSRVIPPAPAVVADISPEVARKSLNLINRFDRLYNDCEMLRRHSVRLGRDGDKDVETIKLVRSFVQSISLRNGVLTSVMTALEKLWNMRRMQEFHDTIIDEIRRESPECAARILARLQRVSEMSGMADMGHRV